MPGSLFTRGITTGITFPITTPINDDRMWGVGGPRASMTGDTGCPTNLAPTVVTIQFDEDVTPALADAMLVKDGCTTANFTQTVATSTWTVECTPTGQGAWSITVPAEVVTGVTSGLPNRQSRFRCTYDTVGPTPTVTGPGTVIQAVPVEVTITFDESVTGLVIGDLTVTGASADSLTGSGSSYTLTITPTIADTDVTVQVPAAVCTDAAGNDNVASNVYTATTAAPPSQPIPTISGTANSSDQTWTLTVNFDQDVNNGELAVGDFSTTGGYTVSNIVKITSTQYTFDVTGSVIDVAGTVTLDAGAVTGVTGGLSSVASNTYSIEWISFHPDSLSERLLQWS